SHKLPAVVSEGAVCLSHLVGVFATLNRSAETVGCIQDLICQALDHRVLATLTGVGNHPAQCQGVSTVWTNLDWNLVGCATNAAGTNLKVWADVAQSLFQGAYWLGAGLLAADFQSTVNDTLCGGLLAVDQNLVYQLSSLLRVVNWVFDYGTLWSSILTHFYLLSLLCAVTGTGLLTVLDTLGV